MKVCHLEVHFVLHLTFTTFASELYNKFILNEECISYRFYRADWIGAYY